MKTNKLLIVLKEVHKTYQLGEIPVLALKGISLEIAAGEFIAIMGPSGSGKTTLMNIIGCLDTLDSGSYQLMGQEIQKASEDELADYRNRYFGFVFQLFNLIPRINAQRNVELPMIYRGIPSSVRRQRAQSMLESVGLGGRTGHSQAKLSGGEQQRVAIARALVNEPAILIADEPTGSLDSEASREIMQIVSRLNQSGKTVILVTHEEEIAGYADRLVRLRDGKIEKDQKK